MICDECGRDNAVYKLVVFMGGQRTQRNLCPECMEKQKQSQGADVKSLLNLILRETQPNGEEAQAQNNGEAKEKAKDVSCPRCGVKLSQVKKGTRMGCATCYKAFRSDLGQFLNRMNGNSQHNGRTPARPGEKGAAPRREDALRQEMELAIACENYERAAEIRDELKRMAQAQQSAEQKGEGCNA